MMKTSIYADNAATTKLDRVALEAMIPWLQEEYGNASQRFIIEYQQYFDGAWGRISIIRDTETGESYILVRSGYGMGLLEVDNG